MKKENFLKTLSIDIKNLEKECNHYKFITTKKKVIKNLKISLRMLKLTAPIVFTAGIVGIVLPFLPGNKPSNNVYAINKTGRYYFSSDFKDNVSYSGMVKVCGNSCKLEDGSYERTVSWYDLSNLNINYVNEAFNDPDLNFSKLFGEPISISNELSETDFENGAQIEIFKSDNDKNLLFKNPLVFLAYLAVMVIQVPPMIKGECSLASFDNYVLEIEDKYKIEDLDVLKRKLMIRKDNYRKFFSDDE